MKNLKKNFLLVLALTVCCVFMNSCGDDDDEPIEEVLVGQDGNPRFNLKFTNEENVDLDLYVKTPNGIVLSYSNAFADGGELDVDCLCSNCPQGPSENIFWEIGTAPEGQFEYWVEYYGNCSGASASSNFVITVTRNGTVLTRKTGTLSSGKSTTWTHTQE